MGGSSDNHGASTPKGIGNCLTVGRRLCSSQEMRSLKITLAFCVSAVGLLLPWRSRILFSEFIGWAAQVVPPSSYELNIKEIDRGRS